MLKRAIIRGVKVEVDKDGLITVYHPKGCGYYCSIGPIRPGIGCVAGLAEYLKQDILSGKLKA